MLDYGVYFGFTIINTYWYRLHKYMLILYRIGDSDMSIDFKMH